MLGGVLFLTGMLIMVYNLIQTVRSPSTNKLEALPAGIVYFTVAVTGLSMSAGLAVLIVGIPFFLLFIGFTRILALAEGRMVEGLLGVRMPRRPRSPPNEATLMGRITAMLGDPRTWTTLLYMLIMLPLGICYFTGVVVALAISLLFIGLPVAVVVGVPSLILSVPFIDDQSISLLQALPLAIVGVLMLTIFMHIVRAVGELHGQIAKRLLVSREAE